MGDLAYIVLEDYENTGGIVFAKSNAEARRIGANLFNGGDTSGLSVQRAKGLDKYALTGVPALVLVAEGWRFECSGCGMSINDSNLDDEGLPVTGVIGNESGQIYCCHACRMQSKSRKAAREAFGEAFVDMLKDMVRDRFPNIEHEFGRYRQHSYVPYPDTVQQANISFSFPGMKHGPATLRYDHCGKHGSTLIGPVRPEYFCANGDREVFEAMSQETDT